MEEEEDEVKEDKRRRIQRELEELQEVQRERVASLVRKSRGRGGGRELCARNKRKRGRGGRLSGGTMRREGVTSGEKGR